MTTKGFYCILMFLSLGNFIWAQQHEQLLEILEADLSYAIKKEQIASFMSENIGKLSSKELAECYHDIGSKWHSGNFSISRDHTELLKAIAITEKSLQLKRKLKASEQCTINKTLYNLGLFNSWDNNLFVAREYYMEVLFGENDYCNDIKDNDSIELSYHGMGEFYRLTGDFYKALEVYDKLISNYITATDKNYNFQIWTYIRIAEIYTSMDLKKNSELVRINLDKALYSLKESKIPCCFYENRINQLEGNRLSEIAQYKDAIGSYQEVIVNLDTSDSVNLARAYNSLGLAHFNLEEKVLAEEILLNASSLNPNYDAPYNNLGDFYLSNHEYERALNSYQTAMDLSLDRSLDLDFDELPDYEQLEYAANKIKLLNHIVTKANAWLSYYERDNNKEHLVRALETFTLADNLVDLIRFESTEYQSKLFWREQGASLYMKAVEVCYLLNRPEEAFHFMERNKALLLLEDLTNEEAKEMANLPQKLAEREFHLKREIFLSENDLQETRNEEQEVIAQLKDSVSASKYRYEQFVDSLNQSYPDYAKFKNKVDILTFNELQSNYISDEGVVLHYILNEEDGYGLLTGTDGPILFQLENTAQLNNDIDSLTSLLSSGISDIIAFNTTSNTLFKNLIPEDIYNKIKGKQLVIVPDYTLQRIPFETLVVDKAKTKYLIEDVEIAYVYSMSLLDHNKGNTRNHSKQLLGLAPVHFDKLGLVELSNSENEILGIAPFFEGDIFLNKKASKANFLKEVAVPKIIHLATHADMGDGENPWIAFSDEKMYLKEIYATKNQSEMVVLSACNTLSGDLKRGEGVMSLARGFFYSGAKSVVSSLWPVTDESGKDLMISFYKNLDKGYSKSKALREAKLNYLETAKATELKHPFYWAGFVVVGDNAPLVASRHPIWIYIGIVLVLVLIYFFRRKLFKRLQ